MSSRMPAKLQVRRFVRLVLPAVLVLLGGVLAALAALTYRLTHPARVPESVHPSHYLLPSEEVSWSTADGEPVAGWWIPGLKGAPGIVLVPGHGLGRADILSLAAALHQDGFNLLLYSQRGCGAAPGTGSTLGVRETEDLMAALGQLGSRKEVSPGVLGIWGMDSGGRAGLVAAAHLREVRAVVVDSPFDAIADFVSIRIGEDWGVNSGLLELGVRGILRLYTAGSGIPLGERVPVGQLGDRAILFIQGENRSGMMRLSTVLFDRIEPQKEMVTLPAARARIMTQEDQAGYDRQVANFFRLNLKEGAVQAR